MSPITLADPSDAHALAGFAARTFRDTYAPPSGPCDVTDVDAYVAEHFGPAIQGAELADPASHTLVAAEGGLLLGYAQLRLGVRPGRADAFAPLAEADPALVADADVELARLYVDRSHHGTGLAARLFEAARALAAERGGTALWFSVYQKNPRALAFYRKRGAVPIATATFTMGTEVQDDWLLAIRAGA